MKAAARYQQFVARILAPKAWITWSKIDFGKYAGFSLPQLFFKDPDYFWFGCEEGFFSRWASEAEKVARRARTVRPRTDHWGPWGVTYITSTVNGKLDRLDFAPLGAPGAGQQYEKIDLSIAKRLARYDKAGNKLMIRDLKAHLFGNPSYKMTKRRCEEFFSDDSNFVPPF